MTHGTDYFWTLLALALAAYGCRISGFWMMRFVTVTPRVEAALRAAPMAVMVGVVSPAAIRGGIPELVGLAAVIVVMRWRRSDLLATLAGVTMVASLRLLLR